MPFDLLQFTFYAGKGGVGKTTCAAARAVAAAAGGTRVLAVSTDPAHSLGDVLGTRLSSRPRTVPVSRAARGGSLHAVEIDARSAFARWLDDHRQSLGDILEHGTWLDREDVDALLGLSIPGIDELVGLMEIARLAEAHLGAAAASVERESLRSSARFSARGDGVPRASIIVDTAPTGHTLRLLAAPETVRAVAEVLDALQEEHRLIRNQLARVGRPEAADRLIDLLARQARDTANLLRDRRRAAFFWVTLPEEMSLAEAEDGIDTLTRSGIRVAGVIVNRVLPGGSRCPICDPRRLEERRVIERVRRRLGSRRTLHVVPAQLDEPRGILALRRIGEAVSPDLIRSGLHVGKGSALHTTSFVVSLSKDAQTTPPESMDVFRGAQLIFFGGKGGVGKTTTAATVALRLARAELHRAVLLLSTDPAHSLGDVFGQPVGDRPTRIRRGPANLYVRELDAAAALAERRKALEGALDEIATTVGAGEARALGREQGASELMELAPPGIDELFGILSVAESLVRLPSAEREPSASSGSIRALSRVENRRSSARSSALGTPGGAPRAYDLIIVDTAPTGHALRLLEMPDAAREWVQLLMRVLLKYKSLVRPGQLAAELVDLSRSIRALQGLLASRRDTRFIVVTRAAEVPRAETTRLVARLEQLRLAAPAVIVNAMTLDPRRCSWCRATAAAEQRELNTLVRRRPPARRVARSNRRAGVQCVIIQTPLAVPPPRGVAALDRWARTWSMTDHRRDR